jgi:hypothetical protein
MAASIDQLVTDVKAEDTVVDSAVLLINGFQQRLKDGIAAALAGGATAAELSVLSTLSTDIQAKSKALSDAIVANTPVVPPPGP